MACAELRDCVYHSKWSIPIYSMCISSHCKIDELLPSFNRNVKKTQTHSRNTRIYSLFFRQLKWPVKIGIGVKKKKIGLGTSAFICYFNSDRIFSVSVNLCLNPENDHVLNTMNEIEYNEYGFNKMITLYV